MSKGESDTGGSCRYYANPMEQKILVQGLHRYFALPERSSNRIKIAKEVSQFLRLYSPHWSHRAVRLWFNNNKHSYIGPDDKPLDPSKISINVQPPLQVNHMQQPMINSPIPVQHVTQAHTTEELKPVPSSNEFVIPPLYPKMSMSPEQVTSPSQMLVLPPLKLPKTTNTLSNSPHTPIKGSPPSPTQKQDSQIVMPPLSLGASSLKKSPLPSVILQQQNKVQFSEATPGLKIGVQFPIQQQPAQLFQKLPPISFSSGPKAFGDELSPEQTYTLASILFNELHQMQESDPNYQQKLSEFDEKCTSIISQFGNIQVQKIEKSTTFAKFPMKQDPSQDFHFADNMPDSISSTDMLNDIAPRSYSFTRLLYATDIRKEPTPDQFASNIIWQPRTYDEMKLIYFESTAMTDQLAAFTFTSLQSSNQHTLSVCRYREKKSPWISYPVNVDSTIEAMTLNNDDAWMITNNHICYLTLSKEGKPSRVAIPVTPGNRYISKWNIGASIAFSSSPKISVINKSMHLQTIDTPYKGFTCFTSIEDNFFCGINKSMSLRMINSNGKEVRSYLGHCAPIIGIQDLGNNRIATRSDDLTVRLWDIRDKNPILSITSPSTCVNLSGTQDYLIIAYHNKNLGVFDIRKPNGKVILGVSTQDYEPASMVYNQSDDILAMFGVVEKDLTKDSMVFVENDGHSRQRIFRVYQKFIGIE